MELLEIRTKGLPVPTRVPEARPRVNCGLGVGDKGLAVDGTGAAEEFALGQVDDHATECFLCY